VDQLVLTNFATTGNSTNNFNFPWLHINTNLVIYYARAIELRGGQAFDESEAINEQSQFHNANGGRLLWVNSYAGYLTSTNLVYVNPAGVAYPYSVNIALAQSPDMDSDSDGIVNSLDPTPIFLPAEVNFTATVTNLPAKSVKLEWTTIPNATNIISYTTNLAAANWLAFTNFKNWYYGNNVAVTNAAHVNSFLSPQAYVGPNPSLPDNGQQTNVWLYDAITNVPHYYRVLVLPNVNFTPQ